MPHELCHSVLIISAEPFTVVKMAKVTGFVSIPDPSNSFWNPEPRHLISSIDWLLFLQADLDKSLTHQLLFHVCRTWGSWMLCLSACSSRKSNMYLMARGRALPRWAVLKMVSNRSSTNFCKVPCTGRSVEWENWLQKKPLIKHLFCLKGIIMICIEYTDA